MWSGIGQARVGGRAVRKVGQGMVGVRDCFWYQSCCLPGHFSICNKGPWALGSDVPGPLGKVLISNWYPEKSLP